MVDSPFSAGHSANWVESCPEVASFCMGGVRLKVKEAPLLRDYCATAGIASSLPKPLPEVPRCLAYWAEASGFPSAAFILTLSLSLATPIPLIVSEITKRKRKRTPLLARKHYCGMYEISKDTQIYGRGARKGQSILTSSMNNCGEVHMWPHVATGEGNPARMLTHSAGPREGQFRTCASWARLPGSQGPEAN